MDFKRFLELAEPREQDRAKTYYHGTNSIAKAKNILQNGLDPQQTDVKYQGRRKTYLSPQQGHVYITPDLRYAIIYAIGGNFLGNSPPDWMLEEPYGAVLEFSGSQLQDINPDEDQVGEILNLLLTSPQEIANYRYNSKVLADKNMVNRFISIAKQVLTPLQYKNMSTKYGKGTEIHYQANVGKKLVKHLSNDIKHWLIDAGAHIAHKGNLFPTRVWVINKRDSIKLANDGSNFFQVAKLLK